MSVGNWFNSWHMLSFFGLQVKLFNLWLDKPTVIHNTGEKPINFILF